jgi:hypothetical protein
LKKFVKINNRLPKKREELGPWIDTQKRIYKNMDLNKIKQLESIPEWKWKIKDKW